MPHGGYHGTVKIGNTTVQQSSRPDGKGGQTGGGQYRAKGYDNKPKKKDLDIINEQRNRLNQINNTANIDNRSRFLASQTPKAIMADAQEDQIDKEIKGLTQQSLAVSKQPVPLPNPNDPASIQQFAATSRQKRAEKQQIALQKRSLNQAKKQFT